MHIEESLKLDFKDVLIRPKRSTLTSRAQVELEYAAAAHKSADGERELLTAMQQRLQAEQRASDASDARIEAERRVHRIELEITTTDTEAS